MIKKYEFETYVMMGGIDIDCLIVYEYIEEDPEFSVEACVIHDILILGGIGRFEIEALKDDELKRLESLCMEHYLKENKRDYGE